MERLIKLSTKIAGEKIIAFFQNVRKLANSFLMANVCFGNKAQKYRRRSAGRY